MVFLAISVGSQLCNSIGRWAADLIRNRSGIRSRIMGYRQGAPLRSQLASTSRQLHEGRANGMELMAFHWSNEKQVVLLNPNLDTIFTGSGGRLRRLSHMSMQTGPRFCSGYYLRQYTYRKLSQSKPTTILTITPRVQNSHIQNVQHQL